jgi:integrase
VKLTINRIEALRCPAGKRDVLFFDEEQRGLGVRVTASGGKTYLVQYNLHGQKRRIPLGSCSAISLSKARDAARVIMGDVARGIDTAAQRKEARRKAAAEAYTLEKLLGGWHALHLASRRPSYAAEAVRALRKAFGKHLDLPAAELSRSAIVKTLDTLNRKGSPSMAAVTRRYGCAAFSWAVKRGTLADNPFSALPMAPVVKRERVLTDAELAAIWRATDAPGPFNAIVRLLILTGQRREEVTAIEWSELSDDLAVWTIPASRTKNGNAHAVSLSEPAREILHNALRIGEYVFPGRRGPFRGLAVGKKPLDKLSGVTDWRLHDLRRTVATGLQRLGVRLEVTEAVLNHISGTRGGLTGIYQRHTWADEKRAALEGWAAHVMAVVEGRGAASGNVLNFQRNA